ncbi:hypothetical protein GLOIN_2v1735228 [Rhizophagus clarus]|uniref:Crinkler effector protein N-terminal domain-containing protein n=1 Tax=Rhizophagus clarus TaxID=94130 RepID=A0A8H3KZR9_9GLOM|nr:hypothetical protein GLOIN_2v1735228 [Rhizophagus clarus]
MSTVELISTPVTLWCIARGSTTAFKVTAGMDNDLSDLRELIRNKKPNDFANVDPNNLILWHVNIGQNRNKHTYCNWNPYYCNLLLIFQENQLV